MYADARAPKPMTVNRSSHPPEHTSGHGPLTVLVDSGQPSCGTAVVLELRGPLETGRIEDALGQLAARRPGARTWQHRLRWHGPGHHTLRLVPGGAGDFPAGLLADLLTGPPTAGPAPAPAPEPAPAPADAGDAVGAPGGARRGDLGKRSGQAAHGPPVRGVEPTPLQRELLADADAHPGTGRHVEQLTWDWHGPLDTDRFTAAWQSVFDRESVLRAAFDATDGPRIVLHDHVTPEVVRRHLPDETGRGAEGWDALVEQDRLRGVDPRRPGPLRLTLLHAPPADGPRTRVLLTYHHTLLDDWSARLLLQEFSRAYLAGGRLAGGDRRPDLGDYARWLATQDTGAAREFWSRPAPPAAAALSPAAAVPARASSTTGTGRAQLRLTPAETALLTSWAGAWGSTGSSVLQAVWALLLYRATGADGPVPVGFGVTVPGRGVPLGGVARLPGALRNPLPMTVTVDPGATVPALLAEVGDRALDMAAYEWVSAGQIRAWTQDRAGRPYGRGGQAGTLLVFDGHPWPDWPATEFAAQGIRVTPPRTTGARTAFPLTLVARYDQAGGLRLTVSYDRAGASDACGALAHSALLLRELPRVADESTTLADVLALLPAPPAAAGPALLTLRAAGGPGAGTVCLVPAPGAPRSRYDQLVRRYTGPAALILLHPAAAGTRDGYAALRPLAETGAPLVLGGFSGAGAAACELARLLAEHAGRAPLVVLASAATSAAELALALESAAVRAG
ncbi:condensation domain-containing protein [Streptomyces hypolithicus]